MQLRLSADLWLHRLAMVVWVIEALLIARLVLKLFAARPDHPVFASLFLLTTPLTMPLQFLDAQQPQFGAVLEFSTLATIVVIALGDWIISMIWQRRSALPNRQPPSA
jgi:uncharacterized protein YggT (Ycf19 family)